MLNILYCVHSSSVLMQFFHEHVLLHSSAFLTHSAKPSQVTLVLLVINHRGRDKNKKEKLGYTVTVQSCAPSALSLTSIDLLDKYFYPHITLPFSKLVPVFAK